jgi:hypothetical protein
MRIPPKQTDRSVFDAGKRKTRNLAIFGAIGHCSLELKPWQYWSLPWRFGFLHTRRKQAQKPQKIR